jgi:hypothetical protein
MVGILGRAISVNDHNLINHIHLKLLARWNVLHKELLARWNVLHKELLATLCVSIRLFMKGLKSIKIWYV